MTKELNKFYKEIKTIYLITIIHKNLESSLSAHTKYISIGTLSKHYDYKYGKTPINPWLKKLHKLYSDKKRNVFIIPTRGFSQNMKKWEEIRFSNHFYMLKPKKSIKLTINQLEYLKLISGFHALTLGKISTKLKKSESSAKQTLNKLVENGYLKTNKSPPGKYGTYFYWITTKTQKLLNQKIKF